VARNLLVARNPTAGNDGKALTISSGGAALNSINHGGGNLVLATGISTGSGAGVINFQTPTPYAGGTPTALSSIDINAAGSGYTAGDVVTINDGATGTTATATVGTVAPAGQVLTISVEDGGSGYAYGDVLTIAGGGGSGATAIVTGLSHVAWDGAVTRVSLVTGGSGYSTTTGASTSGGTGTGATINIDSLQATGAVLTISLTTAGTAYTQVDAATVTGGTGSGLTLITTPFSAADNSLATRISISTSGLTISDAHNIILNSTTGTKIGTATSQKLAFYNSTPIVQPSGNALTALSNLGLVATPTLAESDITNLVSDLAGKQPLDADLTTLAANITAFGHSLVDDVNAAAAIATLGLDADLATFALPAATTISAFGATLVDDADQSAARTTLGLGTIATVAAPSGSVAGTSDTQTLTNKRITKRTGTTTSSATPTVNTDNVDFYSLTAQAADITSFTTNLSGTPTENQTLWIAITGTASRAITWGASFEAGAAALPTTTSGTSRLDVLFVWNTVTSKWRCVAAG
jgi:hypothetical protein